ncbi:hypothetical protein [Thalassotalea atypica]|uniref:hypothetical protein n=1 Tax=Thalassotalea atypica TaxID=2054316 RepID=UPI00257257D7|nr:hypothetical protein [Thalassotalea atypica]
MDIKKVVLTTLILGSTSMAAFAEQATTSSTASANCNDFAAVLANEVNSQSPDIATTLSNLLISCPTFGDQIIETMISLTPSDQHQNLMQFASETGVMQPADILIAAIAGGGDPATLSEPTAAGNLSIVPPSGATAPPIIGGRNGGTGASETDGNTASNN